MRVGGGPPGSTAYLVASLVADVMREIFPEYEVSFYALGGAAVANTKEFIAGGIDFGWATASDMDLLRRRDLWYKDVPPGAPERFHTVYFMTATHILVTTPELREKHRLYSWKALDGKKAVYFSTKFENHFWMVRALDALGVKWTHVEMDFDLVPDALKKEDVVAAMISMTGISPPPWVISLTTKLKTVIIPPTSEEVRVIERMGGSYAWFSTELYKKAGVDVLGHDKTFGVTLFLGMSTDLRMSEDEVYRLLKELIRRKDSLAKMTVYFHEFAEDPIGLQAKAISTAPDLPVHPGLAKLLKEYNAWNPAWKIATR